MIRRILRVDHDAGVDCFDRGVNFGGEDRETALLNDARRCHELFGEPDVSAEDVLGLVAP